jgi:tetratricopeptide (TPR) repeat protein
MVRRFPPTAAFVLASLHFLATIGRAEEAIKLDDNAPDERLRIQAIVNGHPATLSLDTGTGFGYELYQQVMPQLGLSLPAANFAMPNLAPGRVPVDLTSGSCTWTLFGITLNKIRSEMVRLPSRLANSNLADYVGVIGWPSIRENIWVLDLAEGKIDVAAKVPDEVKNWTRWRIESGQRILSLVEDSELKRFPRLLIDTGNPDGILLPWDRWIAWREANLGRLMTFRTGQLLGEDESTMKQSWAEKFALGSLQVSEVPVQEQDNGYATIVPGEPVIVIGLAALKRLDVVLDGFTNIAFVRPHLGSFAYEKSEIKLRRNDDEIYFAEGNGKYSQGDYAGAIGDYNQATALSPKWADAYNNRGLAKEATGDRVGAVLDYDQAIALNPEFTEAYSHRGLARERSGNHAGAIADYDRAIALNSKWVEAYNNRGVAKERIGDYAGAIADYDRAIALNSKDAAAYGNRGIAKDDQENYEGAIADYSHAILLDLTDADNYANRGNSKDEKGDHAGAIADYGRAIQLNPNDATTYFNRGIAKGNLNDHAGAIADYSRAISLNPKYSEAYDNRGIEKRASGNEAGAITDYDQAIALDPKNGDAYANRGWIKADRGKYADAIADFDRYVMLNPNAADGYSERGSVRLAAEDLSGAADDCRRAIELDPKQIYSRFWLSLTLHRLKRKDDSGLEAAVAKEENGWSKNVGLYLLGRIPEAKLIRLADQGKPDSVARWRCEAYYYIGIMHLLRDDTGLARTFFSRCLATNSTTMTELTLARAELAHLTRL